MSAAQCAVDTCERTATAKAYCQGHYTRLMRHGDVKADVPLQSRRFSADGRCEGCGAPVSARRRYCSPACATWVKAGHADLRSEAFATACGHCGGPMEGKRANAIYCSRSCKTLASSARRGEREPDRDRLRYQAERERRLAYQAAYAKANPHVPYAARTKRKQRIKAAGGVGVSSRDWLRLVRIHGERCYYCGERTKLTMDHVIPLARGGKHQIGNILPACLPCNSKKRTRFLVDMKYRDRVNAT